MKILSASQIRSADVFTIQHEPIASIDLMERASNAFILDFIRKYDTSFNIMVFCGTGNNGGDGLAISRMLLFRGYNVQVFVIKKSKNSSEDFKVNYDRLHHDHQIHNITQTNQIPKINNKSIVIDAIFGSGLSRPVLGLFARVIESINDSKAKVISVDIASGLFSDSINTTGAIIEPHATISFQQPKLAFFLPQNEQYVGKWQVVDIGLDQQFIKNIKSAYIFADDHLSVKWLKKRQKFSHKGHFGKALLIAGSLGKMGAAVLSAKACMRTGTGLLTVHLPKCGYEVIQIAIPEAMASIDVEKNHYSSLPDTNDYDVIGIGPGIGIRQKTINAFSNLLKSVKVPLIIDADGINILAKEKKLFKHIPEGSILTPHPKEFQRITESWENDLERLQLQIKFSKKHKVFIVLKGAHTSISTPNGMVYFNSTGNPGMATAGSGDVLTGMITSLLGQGYSPEHAAVLGTYLHGLAGDLAVEKIATESLIATDIIDHISDAFQTLRKAKK